MRGILTRSGDFKKFLMDASMAYFPHLHVKMRGKLGARGQATLATQVITPTLQYFGSASGEDKHFASC